MGAAAIVGSGVTVSVTLTIRGELLTLGDVTVTVPVYVPGARPAVDVVTLICAGEVPDVGLTEIHGRSSETVQLKMFGWPTPATLMACAAGLAPFRTPVNPRLEGVTVMLGG